MKEAKAWVDGSFNVHNGLAGYGVYLIIGGESLEMSGSVTRFDNSSRNIVGEVTAAITAIKRAIDEGCSKITVLYDYAGIENWATGAWKRNKQLTKDYYEEVNDLMKSIDVTFQHVKAHSGDENNNRADRLAKQGCGLK